MNFFIKTHFNNLEKAYKKGSWVKYFFYIFQTFITPIGKVFVIINMIAAPLSFAAFNTTAYAFFTTITAINTYAFLYGFFFRPSVKVSRSLPNLVEVGKIFSYKISIKNTSKRNWYSVKVDEIFWSVFIRTYENNLINIIKPNEEKIYDLTLKINRRGVYTSKGLIVSSSFPFNLFNWGNFYENYSKIFAFPSYKRIENLDIKLGRKFQPGGISLSSNVGDSTEFTGMRDFVYGDNPKYIHWRSWAKTGKPVIKELSEEYFVRLGIILDIYSNDNNIFDNSLAYVASVTDYLSRYDYIVDIFAFGSEFYHFQSGRALAYFENILELLASIEPIKTKIKKGYFDEIFSNISRYIENLSSLIIILLDWDEEREIFIKNILDNGVGVKAVIFSKKLTKEISDDFKEFVTHIDHLAKAH
ncbi:MAG: DUF58 domain-containing protein [Candidatus Sericytochromatia bacterium]